MGTYFRFYVYGKSSPKENPLPFTSCRLSYSKQNSQAIRDEFPPFTTVTQTGATRNANILTIFNYNYTNLKCHNTFVKLSVIIKFKSNCNKRLAHVKKNESNYAHFNLFFTPGKVKTYRFLKRFLNGFRKPDFKRRINNFLNYSAISCVPCTK